MFVKSHGKSFSKQWRVTVYLGALIGRLRQCQIEKLWLCDAQDDPREGERFFLLLKNRCSEVHPEKKEKCLYILSFWRCRDGSTGALRPPNIPCPYSFTYTFTVTFTYTSAIWLLLHYACKII